MGAQVPFERRVNRVTSATFHFDKGAVGSLTHTCLMHEQNFFTTFELMADGMHLIIGVHQDYNLVCDWLVWRQPGTVLLGCPFCLLGHAAR